VKLDEDSHYLSVSSRERSWGLYVTGVGHADVKPYDAYPPVPHPAGYDFQWERGRILEEYALLYLVRGSGVFEYSHQLSLKIRAGDCLILFPGEWHRYKPEQSIGWEEYWVTFQGELVQSWKREKFIRPDAPLLSSGNEDLLSPLFEELLRLTKLQARRRALETAALCHLVIAQALSNSEQSDKHTSVAERLNAAGDHLRLHPENDVDLSRLAKHFGMSYSGFRRSFTKHFGESPDRFHQAARVARVKQFLIETELPLKQIAERLKYSSEFYMMQVFKHHTGLTPTQWRHRRDVSSTA
jgi:AraC-like DNA-binding protein